MARLGALLRAEWGRFGGFLMVGGTSTALNLGIVGALTIGLGWAYLPAALLATECGVLLSFVLNDRLTFRRLAGGAGHWLGRCLRFHATYAAGQVLTIGLGFALIHLAGLQPLAAQACAIATITLFNFGMLRFWAYRSRHRSWLGQTAAEDDQPSLATGGVREGVRSTPLQPARGRRVAALNVPGQGAGGLNVPGRGWEFHSPSRLPRLLQSRDVAPFGCG